MGYYIVAVGGTGNKILESAVYAACADAFYTMDGGRRAPIPRVRMLSVDVDAACGNTTRAKQACEHYERVRACAAASGAPCRGFATELAADRWGMDMSKRAASVADMTRNHKNDQLLARALFSRAESELDYGEGFRGHPDLGVLFFADLLEGLDEAERAGQPDEMLALLREMQSDLDRGETVHVALAGSIFGGTGASGVPSISRFLRKRFPSDQFVLGAVLMLPYYSVPEAADADGGIVVSSAAFLDKARTALQYYGMEGAVRSGAEDASGVYDALYLLGLPEEAFASARVYSTGSQSQENDAHMLEWLATRCIARFFRTGFRGAEGGNIGCYYYQWHTRAFSWESFDTEGALYRVGYGGLMKAASFFFGECYPVLRARIRGESAADRGVNYVSAFFSGVKRMSGSERAKLEKALDSLYRLLAFYVNWMEQTLRTLPPALRRESASGGEEAALSAPLTSELFDLAQIEQLRELLSIYGQRDDARDYDRARRLRGQLLEGLPRLITRRVPDRVDLPRLSAALSGGRSFGKGADGALASFWAALLQAALEEEGV